MEKTLILTLVVTTCGSFFSPCARAEGPSASTTTPEAATTAKSSTTIIAAEAPKPQFIPPTAPAREKKSLDTAAEVALDAAKSLSFLEDGQSYYRAYAKGTHSSVENKAFVKFLEDYERELATVNKELEVLRLWVEKKSALAKE